jgi:protein phosphatase
VLTQAAGAGEPITPDVLELDAAAGQVYLLCTDGLTNMLTDLAIERTLEDTLELGLETAAWALVDAANDRGGIDNITVALLRI